MQYYGKVTANVPDMDKRIFGFEHELGVLVRYDGPKTIPLFTLLEHLTGSYPYGLGRKQFLRNGARYYLDGEHPEYATPECTDPYQLVVHDKAGERIVEDISRHAERWLSEAGAPGRIFIFKNNLESTGQTYGTHENYLLGRALSLDRIADLLLPFLVTRPLLVGAGHIRPSAKGATYRLSQRAPHMYQALGHEETFNRSIISRRERSYANEHKYLRLQVLSGDANMSETTNLLKVASVDLVLRMIEAGEGLDDLRVRHPVEALKATSRDLTGQVKIRLESGGEMSALQLQEAYLQRAQALVQNRDLLAVPHIAQALELWERTLTAIRTGNRTLIERDIDWAIKLKLIEDYAALHGLALDHPRLAQIDLAYHDIRRDRGLYYLLERRGAVTRVATDAEIDLAKSSPPPDTRAAARAAAINWALENRGSFWAIWDEVKVGRTLEERRSVFMRDPFEFDNTELNSVLAELRSAGTGAARAPDMAPLPKRPGDVPSQGRPRGAQV